MNGVSPGPGRITVDGKPLNSPVTQQYLYYEEVEFEAPQYVFDENQKRWRWDSWSDSGDRGHSIETVPYVDTLYTATYSRQYSYTVDSIRPNWSGTGPGWYDPGLDVDLTIERYSIITEGEERYECKGYSVPVLDLASNSLELLFTLTMDTTVIVHWERQFFFRSSNDYNTGSGNLPGWYAEGTTISFAVAQFFPNGDGARRRCAGYSMGEMSEADVYSLVFDIYGYSPLVWTWNQQFIFEPFTNVGDIAPQESWYDVGTELKVVATPPESNDRIRYTFAEWKGIGAGAVNFIGGAPVCNPVIMSPIKQTAVFTVEYYLDIQNDNGTLNPDSSGWYLPGTDVAVNAVPPSSATGSRYIISWFSEDSHGFNAEADFDNPSSIVVTMDLPVIQELTWHLQHKLTIENSSGVGYQSPAVGDYWYFDGDRIHGYSQFVSGEKVCSGFAATGSLVSSDDPYFVGNITESTSVHWAFRDRLELPNFGVQAPIDFAVAGPLCFAYDASGRPTAAFIAPGNQLVFATYNGTTWQQIVLATDVTNVDFISHAVRLNGAPFVGLNDPLSLNTMYITQPNQQTAPNVQPGYFGDSIEFEDDSAINPNVVTDKVSDISYISAYSAQGALILMSVHPSGETSVEVVDAIGVPGFANDIILDPISRLPIIIYNDAFDRSLKIARKLEDDSWQIDTIDDSGAVGADCVAVMGKSGDIYVAYRDYTRVDKSFVKLAVLDSNGWTITKIDSNGNVGRGLSMTLGGDDYPHLLYYGETFVRLVRYMGSSWQFYTLAGDVTPIGDTAIVIGIDDRPIMFYRDGHDSKIIYGIVGSLAPDNSSSDSSGNWTPSTGGSSGGGGCFIATAAFGEMTALTVSSLTNWRDSALSASLYGSALRDMYYSVSPTIASEQNSSLNAILRALLR
ncbi:MAG: CFI-box-CTERM domain-containing protein [Candidatus Thorarchaeota archaeon]